MKSRVAMVFIASFQPESESQILRIQGAGTPDSGWKLKIGRQIFT